MTEHPSEALELRAIPGRDLDRALAMDEEYVGFGAERLSTSLRRYRSWLRGAYVRGELVGICFGNERDPGHVVLRSIAVEVSRWRRGIGSRLLRDFEEQVFGAGMERISLGSAPDTPTESFYIKNGYRPASIMVRVGPEGSTDRGAGLGVTPDHAAKGEEGRRLYFTVDRYEPHQRVALEEAYAASEAIYIFEKRRTS